MLHLGDITKINGAQAPVVDCVIGGSPCQDLSVAGKRAGLAGERSGLFMEQIRIIKEMREEDALRRRSDDDVRPRYMVWENVPGAFSSNGGKDFAAVLEETVRIIEPEAPLFLCLKKDGLQQDASWVNVGASHGGSLTPSFGACRSADEGLSLCATLTDIMHRGSFSETPSRIVETRLSDILEKNPDPKYQLSPNACQGILNRAKRRGKKLPEVLEDALRNQSCFNQNP